MYNHKSSKHPFLWHRNWVANNKSLTWVGMKLIYGGLCMLNGFWSFRTWCSCDYHSPSVFSFAFILVSWMGCALDADNGLSYISLFLCKHIWFHILKLFKEKSPCKLNLLKIRSKVLAIRAYFQSFLYMSMLGKYTVHALHRWSPAIQQFLVFHYALEQARAFLKVPYDI